MDQIVIFRKGEMPKFGKDGKRHLTESQITAWINEAIQEDKIRKVRRSVITAILGGEIAKLPAVTQHEIDKSNGPRNLNAAGKGWIIPEKEFGASGLTGSTVISIKRYIQNAIGIPAEAFSVCLITNRTAVEL